MKRRAVPKGAASVATVSVNGVLGWLSSLLAVPIILAAAPLALAGSWAYKTDIPSPRSGHFAEVLGGLIYAGQGASPGGAATNGEVDSYDPNTDSWTNRSQVGHIYQRASGVFGGKIYAFGGVETGGPLTNAEAYDAGTDSWASIAAMPLARSGATGAFVGDKYYIFGGYTSFGDVTGTTAVHEYDPMANSWSARSAAPRPRIGAVAAAVGGNIYIFSGHSNSVVLDAVDVYDPAADTWTTLVTPMPQLRDGVAIAVLNDKILIIGGSHAGLAFATIDQYDPALDSWTTPIPPMQEARGGAAAAVVNGTLYVIAGEHNGYLSSVEAFEETIHVGDLDRLSRNSGLNWKPRVTVLVHDDAEAPVAGAVVTFSISGVGNRNCTTTAAGTCAVVVTLSDSVPNVTYTVTNVSKVGFTYTPGANHDPEADSNGTVIVVRQP